MDRHQLIRIAVSGLKGEARRRKITMLLMHPEHVESLLRQKFVRVRCIRAARQGGKWRRRIK